MEFLIDKGCNTDLIARRIFDRVPTTIRNKVQEYDHTGYLADGSPLPFLGLIRLEGRLKSVPFATDFVINEIGKDAILGMSFLKQNQCQIDFLSATVQTNGHHLSSNNRWG